MSNSFDSHTVLTETIACQPWELVMAIEGTGKTSDTCAVEFEGQLYIFYIQEKGPNVFKLGYTIMAKNPDNKPRVKSLNELPVQDAGYFRPAVTVYQNRLFCFYTATDQRLRFSVLMENGWSPIDTVPNVLTADAPSVVAHADKLYVALQGTVGSEFYHTHLDSYGWHPNVPAPHISLSGSPSLCVYDNHVHVAIRGLNGRSYIFRFIDNQWRPVFASQQTEVHGSPALHAWENFIAIASLKHPNNRYTTEFVEPSARLRERYETAGAYLSAPCLTRYLNDFYLIGKRPCNDLAISVFNPNCASRS
ncbi:hypothetical protein SB766_20915 [Pseudomonas sp. SIMBA_077]